MMKIPVKHAYCQPWEAGLASETKAVEKRLGRLLDALADEINTNIVHGQINDDVYNLKVSLLNKLRADGWSITTPGNRFKVKSARADAINAPSKPKNNPLGHR